MYQLFFFISFLLLFNIGCSREASQENRQGTPLAVVGGTVIYEEDIGFLKLDDAIQRELLYQEAIRRGVDKDREVQEKIKDVIVGKFANDLFISVGEVSIEEGEVENYYKDHKNEFLTIKGLEIVLNNKEVAEEVYKKALSGEDFKKLVKEYSTSHTKSLGGEMVITSPNYHDSLFLNKKHGDIELVYDGSYEGIDIYRIIKFVKKRYASFDLVKNGIKSKIIMDKKGKLIQDFVDKLKKQKKIEILTQNKKTNTDQETP
ncbi:peptidylprolyl isomerase [Desulfobacterota bacterium AH_259_B03_O07]|nr:peptidylprolyl isomerase [Desulfobacterota bacterium AH_259_B03_O07]